MFTVFYNLPSHLLPVLRLGLLNKQEPHHSYDGVLIKQISYQALIVNYKWNRGPYQCRLRYKNLDTNINIFKGDSKGLPKDMYNATD